MDKDFIVEYITTNELYNDLEKYIDLEELKAVINDEKEDILNVIETAISVILMELANRRV